MLRTITDQKKYTIHATDGDVGRVSGMPVDEKSWAIRYLIVDTGHWWSGHTVLIAPFFTNQEQKMKQLKVLIIVGSLLEQ